MSNYVEYEDTVGFVPWMERNVLSKFRGSNLKFFAVVGIMLLAGFCLIGIGVEADGLYGKILDAYTKYNFLFFVPVGSAFNALKNPAYSLKKQTVYFLIGAVCFLFVVLSAAAIVVLYYGFGYLR